MRLIFAENERNLMKHRKARWAAWLIIAVCATLTTFAGVEIADQMKSDVEKQPSIESKFDYLMNIISVEQAKIDAAKERKTEALMLLGQTAATTTNAAFVSNVVEILIENITFDGKYRGSEPAGEALAAIGEPAVPRLLQVFEDSAEALTVRAAAQALADMKSIGYRGFVNAQKDKMSAEAWKKLSMAPVDIL